MYLLGRQLQHQRTVPGVWIAAAAQARLRWQGIGRSAGLTQELRQGIGACAGQGNNGLTACQRHLSRRAQALLDQRLKRAGSVSGFYFGQRL